MSVSDSATALDPVTVSAGSTLGESFAAAGLTMTGPNAIVVARTDDGRLLDLTHMPDAELAVQPVPMSSPDGLNVLRHSAAHVMAQAVQDLFPESKLGMGPPIENGFYYDFGVEIPFSTEDLPRIEDRMKEIIKRGQRFSRRVYGSAAEALEELSNEPYKLDLIQDSGGIDGNELMEVGEGALTVYDNLDPKTGERCWSDLCRGPHLPSTKMIPAVKLLRTAAAYWRGSEKNPQLQRIYGTAWPTRDELKAHLARLEEAAKRDHRRIGEHLDLFAFSTEVGKGLPLWLPNGTIIRDELEGWARETERAYGYQRVVTPQLAKDDLYYLSGHLPYYAEDLYSPIDIEGETYYLRPMNCPHHHMVYQSRPKSYRELPYRIAEYGTVYRFERSGQLFGLMRTRGFTQNDAHIYCTFDQAREEFLTVMKMHEEYYTALGIEDFHMVLALRDPAKTDKYHDDEEMWRRAEEITRGAMDDSGIPYVEDIGGAAHYGPKVDFMIRTVGGKEYAASTNQVDLYTPSRYDLNYVASDGTKQPVVVIHRAPLGSHERFTSYLVEHFGGAFPVWLAPEQVVVIPVMPDLDDYAAEVNRVLLGEGFRSQADLSDGRLGAKVRTASKRWVPFIAVVGRREAEERSVTVRDRTGTETPMSLDDFVALMHDRIDTKSLIDAGHITKA
ncbi:MAG: threonine--tRNA ligase [Microthrixaceae bacterium]|nr:threonine--tRNA ligase [Microthrixaceae bacterium]